MRLFLAMITITVSANCSNPAIKQTPQPNIPEKQVNFRFTTKERISVSIFHVTLPTDLATAPFDKQYGIVLELAKPLPYPKAYEIRWWCGKDQESDWDMRVLVNVPRNTKRVWKDSFYPYTEGEKVLSAYLLDVTNTVKAENYRLL